MLRISLIIAIVAALAAAALNFTKVRTSMLDTMNERDNERTAKEQALTQLASTEAKLKTTEEDLGSTKKKLTKTEKDLKDTGAKLAAKEKEAEDLSKDLARTTEAKNVAEQEVEMWRQMRITPEQVKKVIADLDKAKKEVAAVSEENTLLAKNVKSLTEKLRTLIGEEETVALPAGLKGKVVAVDPKFDFVVIDVGEDAGAVSGGEMLVNRNGQLVGKIRIASVQEKQSVANILPAWKKDEIMEGDQVLY